MQPAAPVLTSKQRMWILFTVAAVLWFLSIHLYFPVAVIMGFFAVMIAFAAIALLPWRRGAGVIGDR